MGYVRLEDKRFRPEDVGRVVTDKLIEHFPDVVDVNFTAYMESELDDIAEGELAKVTMLHEFNAPFERALEKAEDSFERYQEDLDELCPLCPQEGREPGRLQVKLGRYGKFIGCPNYPECRYIRNMDGSERPEPVMLDETCPECGRQLQQRVGRYGPFVGCSGYPDCRYIKKEPPMGTGVTCPVCNQGELVEKRTRFGLMYGCDRYPECDGAVNNPPIAGDALPRVRRAAAGAAEVDQVLDLRRGDGRGPAGDQAGRRGGRGGRPRGEGRGAQGPRGRAGLEDREEEARKTPRRRRRPQRRSRRQPESVPAEG